MRIARSPKHSKTPMLIRGILGANVRSLMNHRYRQVGNETARTKALGKDAGVGHGTVQRCITGEVALTIDNIERIAEALEVWPYQLLLPHLDAQNPQIVQGASDDERRLYERFKHVAAGLKAG